MMEELLSQPTLPDAVIENNLNIKQMHLEWAFKSFLKMHLFSYFHYVHYNSMTLNNS